MTKPLPDASYILEPNENLAWRLMGTHLTSAWLETLAYIMGLDCGYSATLPSSLFVPKARENDVGVEELSIGDAIRWTGLPGDGWKLDQLRPVSMWPHPQVPDIIFEFPDSQELAIDTVCMFQAVFPIHLRAIPVCGMPLPAALVERDRWGALLCEASGTGKSTMRTRIFDNSCRLAQALPIFLLRTSPSSPFWEDVEKSFPRDPQGH